MENEQAACRGTKARKDHVNPFEFYSVWRVVFGRGEIARLGGLARQLGQAALVVYNGCEVGDGRTADQVGRLLSEATVRATFVRQRGEPTVADVDRGVQAGRRAECELVIGLGGGSAIDAAKAIAALMSNGGSAIDYMEVVGKGLKITRPALPWIAAPTTAGTGAEVTRNAVISLPEKQFKASIRSEHLLPRVALVDPELGAGVPPDVTASSGMDALCQLIEAYTSTGAQPLTDALAMKGIGLAARSLRRVYADGGDLDARQDMALAALLSGIALTNAGLGAVHGFAAPLGARFPAPHGVVCAALLPGVIKANIQAMSTESRAGLHKYAHVGRALANRMDLDDSAALAACIDSCSQLARDLKIPSLSKFGMAEKDIPELVKLARKSSSMKYNPVTLSDEALTEVLKAAVRG